MLPTLLQRHVVSNAVEFYPRKCKFGTICNLFSSKNHKLGFTGLGEFGVKELSGENMTIA